MPVGQPNGSLSPKAPSPSGGLTRGYITATEQVPILLPTAAEGPLYFSISLPVVVNSPPFFIYGPLYL